MANVTYAEYEQHLISGERLRAQRQAKEEVADDGAQEHRALDQRRRVARERDQSQRKAAAAEARAWQAAQRAAAAEKERQRQAEAEYQRLQAAELQALRLKVGDGRTWDKHGVTIERSTGLAVKRTSYEHGTQYSAHPVTGAPWDTVKGGDAK
ncbi:MAG: hypothetical protein ACLP36_04455 [Acidimicrobiales bacterium]